MFASLLEYKEQHGNCLVPQSYPQLGQWVDRQRTDKWENRLDPDRKAKLEAAGIVWRVSRDSWDTMFNRLVQFKEKYGHCIVPQRFDEDPRLGNWVDKQRYLKNSLRLPENREQQLNEIGFTWCATQESWDAMFKHLLEYKKKKGDTLVSLDYKEHPKLGRWVKEQRKKRHRMTDQRKDKLEAAGFVWSVPQAHWETMYKLLVDFERRYGHCLVPKRYGCNPQLGRWVHNQRLRKDGMPAERRAKLESIGFYRFSPTPGKAPNCGLSGGRVARSKVSNEIAADAKEDSSEDEQPLCPGHQQAPMEQSRIDRESLASEQTLSSMEASSGRSRHQEPSANYQFQRHGLSGRIAPDVAASSVATTGSPPVLHPRETFVSTSSTSSRQLWPSMLHQAGRNSSLSLAARYSLGQQLHPASLVGLTSSLVTETMALELRQLELASLMRYQQLQPTPYYAAPMNNASRILALRLGVPPQTQANTRASRSMVGSFLQTPLARSSQSSGRS